MFVQFPSLHLTSPGVLLFTDRQLIKKTTFPVSPSPPADAGPFVFCPSNETGSETLPDNLQLPEPQHLIRSTRLIRSKHVEKEAGTRGLVKG